eukprot:scaffold667_cov262-Pinguiococcus_pyrenoidosus.AAC.7
MGKTGGARQGAGRRRSQVRSIIQKKSKTLALTRGIQVVYVCPLCKKEWKFFNATNMRKHLLESCRKKAQLPASTVKKLMREADTSASMLGSKIYFLVLETFIGIEEYLNC